MKKVIGKNQVIITSLAILIAVAGYLNFADVDLGFRIRRQVRTAAVSLKMQDMILQMKLLFWMKIRQMEV